MTTSTWQWVMQVHASVPWADVHARFTTFANVHNVVTRSKPTDTVVTCIMQGMMQGMMQGKAWVLLGSPLPMLRTHSARTHQTRTRPTRTHPTGRGHGLLPLNRFRQQLSSWLPSLSPAQGCPPARQRSCFACLIARKSGWRTCGQKPRHSYLSHWSACSLR